MAIVPVPTTRISGLLARERLLAQLQGDQLDVFRLQNQISTGRRITLPSEDAPAAQRAVTLQRLLERKTQLRSSVDTAGRFLANTDASLSNVASTLGDIRGAVLGVAGTTSSQAERDEVVNQINAAIESLVAVANSRFLGRYLFAGSQTNVKPYSFDGTTVRYSGNNKSIDNYSDIGVLFSTNSPGMNVFGGISGPVLGGVDLDPQLTADTPLSSLRRGQGISPNGALQISDGTNTVVVDVSRAVTVGDVQRLIEANAPPGRKITVGISGDGLTLQLDAAGGGNLTVSEVGSGSTARELRILDTAGVGTGPLVGGDLDPVVKKTTALADLLGAKARGLLVSAGDNNDLRIEAAANGAQYNGATVQFVDAELLTAGPGVAPGSEYAQYDAQARAASASLRFTGAGNDLIVASTNPGVAANNVRIVVQGAAGLGDQATAAYDAGAKVLTITVDDAGATTVDQVVAAINGTGSFTAAHDPTVEGAGAYDGGALIAASDIGVVEGNTGNSGGAANTLYVFVAAGASTANHVVAAINAQGAFRASLDANDSSSLLLAGGGVVGVNATATLAGGDGAGLDLAAGIRVVNGGQTHTFDFSQARTVEDLLNVLNHPDSGLSAEINAAGTGIDVRSRLSGGDFQIGENGGQLATQLGLRSFTGATRLDSLNYGVGVPTRFSTQLAIPTPPPASYPDFTIVVDDGAGGTVELTLDVHTAATVQDVLNQINNHPANNVAGVAVLARLASTGNGIELVDLNGRPLAVRSETGSQAAQYLGLVPMDATTASAPAGTLTGADQRFLETESVFTTLLRLRDALRAGDLTAISRSVSAIDVDVDRVAFAQAEVGSRQRALDVSSRTLEDEDVELRSALSSEIEVDLVEAISNLTARQVSMQASLQAIANIMQLSLLNFL